MKIKNNLTKGIICILISGLAFSLMALFVKLSGNLPVTQKVFFRNIIIAIISLIPIIKNLKLINYPKNSKEWLALFLRSLFGMLGLLCNFYAISTINLADSTVIQRLSPFIVLIISFFAFKEKMSKLEIITVFIAFLGMIFIVKPSGTGLITYGALIALIGAFFAGSAYAMIRYLGINNISAEFIVFFFSVFSVVTIIPFIIFDFQPMNNNQLIYLILVGLTGAVGQYGLTYAYKYAAAKSLSVFDYFQILFSGILGYIFFMEIPDIYSLFGYVIIVSMGILLTYKKDK